MYIVLSATPSGITVHELNHGTLTQHTTYTIPTTELPHLIADQENLSHPPPRWVWSDTTAWYPPLLTAGIRIRHCWDLRLVRAILRHSTHTAHTELAAEEPTDWDRPRHVSHPEALFDLIPAPQLNALDEFRRQYAALTSTLQQRPLHHLLAAESAGALIAAEMTHAGIPWDLAEHQRILTSTLGPRPRPGTRPLHLEAAYQRVRTALQSDVNPDSPAELLKTLQNAGLPIRSTRSWELSALDHPVIAPLLEYKKLSRLHTANGWAWLETWITTNRFHPTYIVGGVVTGRWASDGGGVLQLPHHVRGAIRADPQWTLVVADAAQLEPRILAAISHDTAMATAGKSTDMYQAMVDSGAVPTREQAKFGMLGAMYGGTQGESGRMLPRITAAYPTALATVEQAARIGEKGGIVSTWLGRSSPLPSKSWYEVQAAASDPDATRTDQERARSQARSWGRFTRNFIVQGTAAEWALCWMALVRLRLHALSTTPTDGPHLVFFLHDEIIVHTPRTCAVEVNTIIEESAVDAGRLLFPNSTVEFPLSIATASTYASAKTSSPSPKP